MTRQFWPSVWRVGAAAAVIVAIGVSARPDAAGQQPPQRSGRTIAPVDLTGYWVSVVSEDWRHRMATARPGDFESLPLNGEGRRVASAWDLERDNAAGLQCKAFGVGGLMRQPGRLHIFWQDDDTLQVDFDAGTQTRLLRFDASSRPTGERTWQGHSVAAWEGPGVTGRGRAANAQFEIGGGSTGPVAPGGAGQGLRGGPPPSASIFRGGSLKVVTTAFREGYLRKNGVPYSEEASITEYFHRLPTPPEGDVWLLVVTIVEDPTYLSQPFYTSTHFKLEPDDARWNPTPCRTAPPPSGPLPETEDRTRPR
jgi:hypothetical protein